MSNKLAIAALAAMIPLAAAYAGDDTRAIVNVMRGGQIADGTYRVGLDVGPGTYQSQSRSCTWERLKGFGGTIAEIIAMQASAAYPIVTISPSDKGFKSRLCGVWRKLSD